MEVIMTVSEERWLASGRNVSSRVIYSDRFDGSLADYHPLNDSYTAEIKSRGDNTFQLILQDSWRQGLQLKVGQLIFREKSYGTQDDKCYFLESAEGFELDDEFRLLSWQIYQSTFIENKRKVKLFTDILFWERTLDSGEKERDWTSWPWK